jgi:hypothetical protein
MRKFWTILSGALIIVFLAGSGGQAPKVQTAAFQPSSIPSSAALKVDRDFGKMPLYFIPNQGQMDARVAYYLQGKDKTIYFTSEGLTYVLSERSAGEEIPGKTASVKERLLIDPAERELRGRRDQRRFAVKLDFVGANADVRPSGEEKTGAVISYFKGKPEEWKAGLPTYSRIVYKNLWPGIDVAYYGTVDKMKYEFVVHPGSDPSLIRLAYRGASTVEVNGEGRLEVRTPAGDFEDDRPVGYQEINGDRVDVAMSYLLEEPAAKEPGPSGEEAVTKSYVYGFEVGDYDRTKPLVLDPAVLVYCGYIGGSGDDKGYNIEVDGSGNAYVTGRTSSTQATFPVTVGLDPTFNGGDADAFVAKVNSSAALVYCSYIGGLSGDYGRDIAVDSEGNANITGYTASSEATFPVLYGPGLTYSGSLDAFIAKINSSGTALYYCGYIGGSAVDVAYGIAIDNVGDAYVTGYTASTQATFPVLGGPDLTHNGGMDAFVAKVNSTTKALEYCGYIGGSGLDMGHGIAVYSFGMFHTAYITGQTASTEATFPVSGGGDLTHNGGKDAFIAAVGNSFSCGYIGGSGDDEGTDIALNWESVGNVFYAFLYVTGYTTSTEATFPVLNGPDLTHNGGSDAFIAKYRGWSPIYCGYIGGSGNDAGYGIKVDSLKNAYVSGNTTSTQSTFPVVDGPDLTHNGGTDGFVAKVNASGTALIYCGYIGGSGNDYCGSVCTGGIGLDGSGNAYISGYTGSTQATFPVVVGPDLTFNGSNDAFVAKISLVNTPSTPTDPHPANGATGVFRNPTLTWSSTGATSYDVYGGLTPPLSKIATVNTPSYTPGTPLPALTKFYWKIVAINKWGSTSGPLWSFTTGSLFHSVSTPTTPSGPSSNNINTSCAFTTGDSTCNLGHGVQYRFDWGDGQYSAYGSSSASHSWPSYGTYSIRAQARCATDNRIVSSWSAIKTVNISGGEFLSSGSWTGAGHGTDGWYVGDFNGDNRDDIFRYVPGTSGADVFLSDGTKFVSFGSWTGAGHGTTDGWYVGDFNGDNRDDIFRYVPGTSGAEVFLSNGTKFVYSGSWTGGSDYWTDGWYVGDFNGDNRDDIFRYVPGTSGAEVFLSNGTQFTNFGSWTGAGHGTDGWYIGDFNGDGKDDIFRYVPGTSGADVFLSDGVKFVYSGSWTGAGHGDDGWYVADFNGDGKDDIFRYVSGVSGAQVFVSTGAAFVNMGSWTAADHGADGWYVGYFNLDPKADIFRYLPGTSGAEVFLSHFPISSLPFVSGEPILAFDEDMMLDIQGTRETKMSYQEEEEFLKPYFQRLMNGDEPSIYEIKSALEERVGDRVRKIVINQLLFRHAYWRLVEGLQRTKEER